jgi:hypothetical protein
MRPPKLKKHIQVMLLLLLASIVSHSALAQIPVGDKEGESGETRAGIYAKPLSDSAAVRAVASSDARVIDRIPANTVLVTVSSEGEFEEIKPLAGSDIPWETGYVLSDQLEVGIDLPWRTGGGIFGSLAAVTSGESVLAVNGSPVVSNPLGEPGSGSMLSLGITLSGGYFIPVGENGFKVRLDGEYSLIQGNDQAQNVDSTNFSMIRVGVGGSMVYRMTSLVDVSIGAVAGGGPVRNKLSLVNNQTVTGTAWYGTTELFAGIGYGRNHTSGIGLKGRLEGGYRFGTKITDWSYDFEEGSNSSTVLQSGEKAFSIGGPFIRLVIGI